MEADWAVALAADDPVITVPWTSSKDDLPRCKFIDLRLGEHWVDEIAEIRSRPALRSALLRMNASTSPLWTAKCDAWTSSVEDGGEAFDPYEMGAEAGETGFGAGSYIDLVPREISLLSSFERQERWIRAVTETLRAIPASGARVELVIRAAEVEAAAGFGVTWFVEGCGATAELAGQNWGTALDLALAVILDVRLM